MVFKQKFFNKEYICPYCFEKHPLHQVKFRCDNERCDLEDDDIYSTFNGYSRPQEMHQVSEPAAPTNPFTKMLGSMPSEVDCKDCGEQTTIKICPSCHSELPSTIGEFEDLIFAIVGAKETGKSHYISVLIHELSNIIRDVYDCVLEPLNDETITRYRNDFSNPLFKRKETIQATRSGRADQDVQRPLLYTLKFLKKDSKQNTRIHKVITLAFFDAAGEDLDSEDTMSKVNKYISNSAGIILLLDPLQLNHVRENISPDVQLPTINSDSNEILHRMTNLIRKAQRLKQTKQIPIPLAVSFSKIDAVKPMLDLSSPLRSESRHEQSPAFDLTDFKNVQDEIEVLIKDWSETGMTHILQANYASYGFFGLSSLGHNPESGVISKDIEPYRVTDPFLWLLAEHKIIETKKTTLGD